MACWGAFPWARQKDQWSLVSHRHSRALPLVELHAKGVLEQRQLLPLPFPGPSERLQPKAFQQVVPLVPQIDWPRQVSRHHYRAPPLVD